ncbi:MAG: hypothetical protein KJZ83_10265 [Burkholderiaceae bacterium]|nr:hypothetical protein [Burkholderiaceae bacterium]
MNELLQNPAVQAGVGPLLVALVLGAALARTRLAWAAVAAGYATMIALSVGFQFTPLSVSRKVLLLVLASPLAGLALDLAAGGRRGVRFAVCAAAAGAAIWAFSSVLVQREMPAALWQGGLIAATTLALSWSVLARSDDGIATGAAGLGLGLASGVAALLSASIGLFMAGVSVAAGCGAMLLVQLALRRALAPGFVGALGVAMAGALFAGAAFTIAKLPWYALPLFVLVPVAASVRVGSALALWQRAGLRSALALAAAVIPILAAWLATRLPAG